MITLTDYLNELDFSYKVNDDNTLSLVDLQGGNLGDIESERFEINDSLPSVLRDRLCIYDFDYHFNGILETLESLQGRPTDIYLPNEELIPAMKQYPEVFGQALINFIDDLVNDRIDISELKGLTK